MKGIKQARHGLLLAGLALLPAALLLAAPPAQFQPSRGGRRGPSPQEFDNSPANVSLPNQPFQPPITPTTNSDTGSARGAAHKNASDSSSLAPDAVVVDARTEAIIKAALKYLAAKQTPNGSWTSPGGAHPVAVTGYTLMALLAAGQLPDQGEYGKNVKRGADYLMTCAKSSGYISSDNLDSGRQASNMYDHGIATIALAEMYGQAQDPKVRQVVTASINLIVGCQNQQGGWRYTPTPTSADISVTVLQVVALRAAKNGGINVPQSTIDRAVDYVRSCSDGPSGGFKYMTNSGGAGFARTAAAIYSLQVCGQYDDPLVERGSQYLMAHFADDRTYFTYGNFYAAPAQYMIGGATWQRWYELVKGELLDRVITQPGDRSIAYWDGIDANGKQVGPAYATAVYTMILAMPYHYVPLYQR